CQKKLNEHGAMALLASRFVPGTRLPTYLAAGLLSLPVARFAIVTATAALLWIGGIFAIAKLLGSQALICLSIIQSMIAAIFSVGRDLTATHFAFRRLRCAAVAGVGDSGGSEAFTPETSRRHRRRLQLPAFLRRWMHWEFWPGWLFYIPVGVYYAWLAIRHRSLTVPTSANPGIATGGFVGESKLEILDQLRRRSPQFTAEAFLIDGPTTTDRLLCLHRICGQQKIVLPFILKPDIGQRGNGVKLIRSMRAALEYLEDVEAPIVLQRYIAGPREAGVFYYRFPGESHGR